MEKWVQRYEIRYAHDITQKADGTFVTYEAYKQLQTKIEQLKAIEACWHDYKKMAKKFGFATCSGGINRWTQDKLEKIEQQQKDIGELIKAGRQAYEGLCTGDLPACDKGIKLLDKIITQAEEMIK